MHAAPPVAARLGARRCTSRRSSLRVSAPDTWGGRVRCGAHRPQRAEAAPARPCDRLMRTGASDKFTQPAAAPGAGPMAELPPPASLRRCAVRRGLLGRVPSAARRAAVRGLSRAERPFIMAALGDGSWQRSARAAGGDASGGSRRRPLARGARSAARYGCVGARRSCLVYARGVRAGDGAGVSCAAVPAHSVASKAWPSASSQERLSRTSATRRVPARPLAHRALDETGGGQMHAAGAVRSRLAPGLCVRRASVSGCRVSVSARRVPPGRVSAPVASAWHDLRSRGERMRSEAAEVGHVSASPSRSPASSEARPL
jgi:hypothetical protein